MLISILILTTVSFFPTKTFGSGAGVKTEEKPQALPLVAAASAPATDLSQNVAGEIWQEDDREVLIRSARGANKNNGGTASGANAAGNAGGGGNNGSGNSGSGKKEKQANKRIYNRKNTEEKTIKKSPCRYEKSPWTDCDAQTNLRSRTLTLKKGDDGCVATRTIEKKCKKACRYDKGEWTKCVNGSMSRKDSVRAGSDPSCKPTREINKNCNKDKKSKKQDKNARKSRA